MARVTYGALITELAGSIGGITFQRNSSGSIARLKPNMPVNPSESQQGQQLFLSKLLSSWSALSLADKTSWDNFAAAHDHVNKWSETKHLNGFQWFMSCNLNLLVTGQAAISTAPAWTVVPALPVFSFITDAATFTLDWNPAYDVTGYRTIIYSTPPIRQNTLKLRRSTFLIHQLNVNSIDQVSIKAYFESAFNITWADLFADANCNIIIRVKTIQEGTGLSGPFISGILKIN